MLSILLKPIRSTFLQIAAIEPIERKLDDISSSWFARSIRTGDTKIRSFLNDPSATNFHRWDDGEDLYSRSPTHDLGSSICAAARLSATDTEQLSYGDCDDTSALPPGSITDMTTMDSREERFKHRAPWLAMIRALLEEAWRAIYSDRSGAEGHAASAAHIMSCRDEPVPMTSSFLGLLATSGDAELQGILLALQASQLMDQVIILSDSQASIASVHKLGSGEQVPCSGIERVIKQAIAKRGSQNLDTSISWVWSHIGIPGNELADKAVEQRRFTRQLLSEPYTATAAGI